MARDRLRRQNEIDRLEQQARHRREQELRSRRDYYEDTWSRPENTLGPNEEVMEKRRRRKHVVVASGSSRSHNILGENIAMLIGLVICIIALYHICLYVLNQ